MKPSLSLREGFKKSMPLFGMWNVYNFHLSRLHIFLEYAYYAFCRTQLNLKEPQLGQDDEMSQFEEVKL